jgi:UDP-N-acetylmuramoyl-L-alanyl-D-glutamate--2,6-diaminopimelate ligase
MQLSKILSQVKVKYKTSQSLEGVEVSDIALDSRLVKKGAVFFALVGKNQDGSKFVEDAIAKGAGVVISRQSTVDSRQSVVFIECEDVFSLLVEVLQIFYNPLPANIYAVTGTNGKTSTAEFTRQILQFLGKKSASIGTLGVVTEVSDFKSDVASSLTTPDVVSLYKNLYNLKKVGVGLPVS